MNASDPSSSSRVVSCLACVHGPPNATTYYHCPSCHYQRISPGRYGTLTCPLCYEQMEGVTYERSEHPPEGQGHQTGVRT